MKATSEAPTAGRVDRRDRVGGAQQAVDGVGLAADLGGDPAGQHGDEARRAHQHGAAQQRAAVVEARRASARHRLHRPEQHHQHADADHDAEAPEHDGALGRSARGQALRPFTSPFQSCVRMKLPSLGTSMRVAGGLGLHVGPAEQDQRLAAAGSPSGPPWRRSWPAGAPAC